MSSDFKPKEAAVWFACVALLLTGACERSDSKVPVLRAVLEVRPSIFYKAGMGTATFRFRLTNSSNADVDTKPGSWRIIVDSVPFSVPRRKTVLMDLSGPQPIGGWGILPSRQTYEFCRTLDLADYVRQPGTYTVWWTGTGFESIPVEIKVPSTE